MEKEENHSKPPVSTPMIFEVFTFARPPDQVTELIKEKEVEISETKIDQQEQNDQLITKKELEKEEHKEYEKIKGQCRGTKCKHEESVSQRKKERELEKGVHKSSSRIQKKVEGAKGEEGDSAPN